jgi:tetratricopeptide (TPR) repeat protein
MRSQLIHTLELDRVPEAESSSLIAGFDAAMNRLNTTDLATNLIEREILQPSVRAMGDKFINQPHAHGLLRVNIAQSFATLSMRPEALIECRKAITLLSEAFGPDDRRVLAVQFDELMLLIRMNEHEGLQAKAEDLLERAQRTLPESDVVRLIIENQWAGLLQDLDKREESLALYQSVLDRCRRFLPPGSDVTNRTMARTAELLADVDRDDEAQMLIQEAIKSATEAFGPTHDNTLTLKFTLATVYMKCGKPSEALAVLDELIDVRTTAEGRQNLRTINPLLLRSGLLVKLRRFAEAEADTRRLIAALGTRDGFDSIRVTAGTRMARLLVLRREFAAAEEALQRQLELVEPHWREPLLDRLQTMYDAWAARDPSVDLKPKLQALSARRAELQPAPVQAP